MIVSLILSCLLAFSPGCHQQTLDPLGHYYQWEGANLTKIRGGETLYFSKPEWGSIAAVNASNPNYVVLYFPEARGFVVLNRDLVQTQDPINLAGLEATGPVKSWAVNAQGQLWVYLELTKQLWVYDLRQKRLSQTIDLLPILRNSDEVLELQVDMSQVIIALKSGDYLLCNPLGILKQRLNLGKIGLRWSQGKAYAFVDGELQQYDPELRRWESLIADLPEPCHFLILNQGLYLWTKQGKPQGFHW